MNQTTQGVITKILILALVLTIGPVGNVVTPAYSMDPYKKGPTTD